MISTTQALTGPWAANLRGAAWMGVPLTLLAVIQEILGGRLAPGVIVVSVLLQLLASVAWSTVVAAIARRATGRVPVPALLLMWAGFGVARGLVGGAVASAAGVDPDWAYRVLFWTAISLIWTPLITFGLAQFESRKRILGRRSATRSALAAAATRAAESTESRDRRLAQAVDDALRPALDEIREGLRHTAGTLDEGTLAQLAARIDELTDRTSGFSTPSPEPTPDRLAEPMPLRVAAQDFELRRPVVAALVTAVATAAFLFPEALREGGWAHVAEAAVAIVAATTLMYGAMFGLRATSRDGSSSPAVRRVSIIVGALAGAALLGVLPWEPFEPRDLIVIALFPLLFAIAASTVSMAVALARTNAELGKLAEEDREALGRRRAEARAADERAAAGLVTLVRGDLNGRLASCAMALGFLASGGIPPESRDAAIGSVVSQLDEVAWELDRIAAR